MEQARSSAYRPFPAKNKYLLIDFQGYKQIDREILTQAIAETCNTMLNPPAKLLGVNGILKFSIEILKWEKFSLDKLKLSGTTNYFQISKDGGTGGGIFRKMYGDFLIEASTILDNKNIAMLGTKFLEVATQWDKIADDLWQLSLSGLLQKCSCPWAGRSHRVRRPFTRGARMIPCTFCAWLGCADKYSLKSFITDKIRGALENQDFVNRLRKCL